MHDLFESAVEAFEGVLGKEFVRKSVDSLQMYLQGDIPQNVSVTAAVLPKSAQEVQDVIRIASEFMVPLYPISTGNNWGYGAARPIVSGCVIVDMRRMNRIIEVNTELAYAVVEPGVTQHQMYRYLEDNKIPLFIDPTGAGPNCSLLGNTVERGYGITPYGDHFQSQCGMEVVLASGEILRTGFGHYEQAKATYTFKGGVGPYLDGIFTQSNFGIVTKIGLWLMPKPEHFEAFYFHANSDGELGGLVDAVRTMLLHGVVSSSMNLMHRNRVLTLMTQYPWQAMSGKVPMSEEVAKRLGDDRKIGIWNGVGALYGTKQQVSAAKSAIRKILSGKVAKLTFVSHSLLGLLERFPGLLSLASGMNVPEVIKVLKPSFNILQGVPNEVALATPYWRMKKKSHGRGTDPSRDNCGVIWLSPVVPMTQKHVAEFRGIIEPLFAKHGFDCCITFTTVTARSFDCTIPILYDRDDPADTDRASACYEDLLKSLMDSGYIPYRFGIQSVTQLAARRDTFWDTVEKLKHTLDPKGILAPGRYGRV